MDITPIIDYVVSNAVDISALIGGVVTVATIVARLTPTDRDNKFIEKWIRKPAEWISNVGLPNLVKVRSRGKSRVVRG
jgi:hypothetical protein